MDDSLPEKAVAADSGVPPGGAVGGTHPPLHDVVQLAETRSQSWMFGRSKGASHCESHACSPLHQPEGLEVPEGLDVGRLIREQ